MSKERGEASGESRPVWQRMAHRMPEAMAESVREGIEDGFSFRESWEFYVEQCYYDTKAAVQVMARLCDEDDTREPTTGEYARRHGVDHSTARRHRLLLNARGLWLGMGRGARVRELPA